MSFIAWFKRKGPSGFGHASTAEDVTAGLDLTGRRILITGCNSGIGFESLKTLGARGATLYAAARTTEKAAEAARLAAVAATPVALELDDPASVRAAITTLRAGPPLDVLLLNAGIMALPRAELVHGLERQFFTNHIGHFMLATGLLDHLGPTARVVLVSSSAHKFSVKGGIDFDNLDASKGYSSFRFYGQSKLANVLFARELARRFAGTDRRAFAVHPGVIRTNLGRHMNPVLRAVGTAFQPLFMKSAQQGAATQCWAAVHPDATAHNGAYLADCNVAPASRSAQDDALAARLWTESERIIAAL
jgi:WW domain-containing oxidoreductase